MIRVFVAAGNRRVTVRTFPRMNHLMVEDPTGDLRHYPTLRIRVSRGKIVVFRGKNCIFPIARPTRHCILRPVVQRFSQSENLFTFPGDEHGREEEEEREEGR